MIGGSAAVAAAFGGPINAMAKSALYRGQCLPGVASPLVDSPYGPTAPVNDLTTGLPLIELPVGFRYLSYGWTGDLMSDGLPTPGAHDGMGVVVQRRIGVGNETVLVRNHERSTSTSMASIIGIDRTDVAKYDLGLTGANYQAGGNTNLVFSNGRWVDSWASLGGIYRPCAGGASSWGSWLSNEELRSNSVSSTGKKHGYVFEIPADTTQNAFTNVPILDMGRMAHEASALDPATGYWYLTEDQGDANTLYRVLPKNVSVGLGSLHAGGKLQGLAVANVRNADLRFPRLCQKSSASGSTSRTLTWTAPRSQSPASAACRRVDPIARPTRTVPRSSVRTKAAGWPTLLCTSVTSASPPARIVPGGYGRWILRR